MIEHVVISGGGPNGLIQLGVVAELLRSGHVTTRNLKSVYGTSAGAIICVILALHIPMDDYCEYLISRPWHKWLDIRYLDANCQGGLMPAEKLKDSLSPMLTAHGFEGITLKEAFEKTKVDLHLFTTELQSFSLVDLNHLTFPNMPVVQAACMSAALFPLFAPALFGEKTYVDGGLRNNFPIDELLKTYPDTDAVLGINLLGRGDPFSNTMTALETMVFILHRVSAEMGITAQTHAIGQTCKYYLGHANRSMLQGELWEKFLTDSTFRRGLVDEGVEIGREFINEKWASLDEHC